MDKKQLKNIFHFLDNTEYSLDQDIIDGLNLISEYLQTNLFLPNNINFPYQRKKFIDDFKF